MKAPKLIAPMVHFSSFFIAGFILVLFIGFILVLFIGFTISFSTLGPHIIRRNPAKELQSRP